MEGSRKVRVLAHENTSVPLPRGLTMPTGKLTPVPAPGRTHWRTHAFCLSGLLTAVPAPAWEGRQGAGQGSIRMAVHRRRKGVYPPPPIQTKVTIVGKNEIYDRENLIGPSFVHKLFGTRPTPSPPFNTSLGLREH